jgi:hypothetical protein
MVAVTVIGNGLSALIGEGQSIEGQPKVLLSEFVETCSSVPWYRNFSRAGA